MGVSFLGGIDGATGMGFRVRVAKIKIGGVWRGQPPATAPKGRKIPNSPFLSAETSLIWPGEKP